MTDKEKWLDDIRTVIATPAGRRLYWGIMGKCKVFKDEFSSDTNFTYFRKGQRSIGLDMMTELLEAKPEAYLQMVQEKEAKSTREDIKVDKVVKEKLKNPTKLSSPSLPNTELVRTGG